MSAKTLNGLLMICGTLSFLAFLVVEPLRPEILSHFADGSANGRVTFTIVRCLLILLALTSFAFAFPRRDNGLARTVPIPMAGNDPLLTLRAFAFIMVIAGHGLVVVFPPSGVGDLLKDGSNVWLLMGSPWAGVWVFFVLSGYLMAKGFYRGRYDLSREKILTFYKNRILRIAPTYYLVLLVTALVSSPAVFQPSNWWEIAALAVFSQQNGAPHPIVGALWSIQTEMAFYAAVPLLYFAINKVTTRYSAWVLAAGILVVGWAYRSCVMNLTDGTGWLDRVYIPLIGNIDLFVLGMSANWALPSARRWLKSSPTLSMGLIMLVPLYASTTYYFSQSSFGVDAQLFRSELQILGPTLVGFTTFLIILLFELHVATQAQASFIPRKIVAGTQTLGILTYALYAWHEPVFLLLRKAGNSGLTVADAVLWLALALVVTTALAFITYRLFESSFERRKSFPTPVSNTM